MSKKYLYIYNNLINLTRSDKIKKFSLFLSDFGKIDDLLNYFEQYNDNLSKKTLNSYLKSVSNP